MAAPFVANRFVDPGTEENPKLHHVKPKGSATFATRPHPDKAGGLNGSTQYLPEDHLQQSR
jgi:hypothetical protein